ncbi:hypothetical protein B6D60_08715 [candidate division KSB1 bacterium 4484_87]|nr:MAG: hypothetical protein B6D60_08715 [candidate division KSB1 bacterium 4484_87]
MMKLAIIGIGKMGMLHAGIMNALDDVELCAVSDSTNFLLNGVKSLKPELNTYDNYVKMLDKEQPDAVVIATPVFLHVPMAEECTKRNIPFFLEKPLSPASDQAVELIEMVESKDLVTMVGYMMRYVDTYMKAKAILESGVLGKVITVHSTIYVAQLFRKGKGWRYSKEQAGGGVVIGQATHLIDLLQWMLGPVERVTGHTINWYSEEVEDFAHVHFEFKNGAMGWMDSSWSIRHHRLMQINIEIHAEKGNLFVCDDYAKLYLDEPADGFNAGWTNWYNPDLFHGVEIDVGGPQYSRQGIAFIDAVKNGKPVASDLRNAFEVQKIVDAIYKSAENHGQPTDV